MSAYLSVGAWQSEGSAAHPNLLSGKRRGGCWIPKRKGAGSHWRRRFAVLGLAAAALGLAACDSRKLQCGDPGANANVSGEWSIAAEGRRSDCVSKLEEADISVRSQRVLRVGQLLGGSGRADTLVLLEPVSVEGGSFSFSGSVEGGCVDFQTTEIGPGYELRLSFEGNVSEDAIEGDFTEPGSGECRTEGSFEARIAARGAIVEPGADAGELDADAGELGLDAGREHRCTRAEDCNQGACIEFQCVPQCAVATECRIGEVCTNQRCEPAPGCGCSSGGSAGGFAVLALVLLHRRSRSSPRSSIGPHAPSPGSPS